MESHPGLIPRAAEQAVHTALDDTRVVVINGARQVGKSTLASQVVARRGGRSLTLDDDVVRAAAREDPAGFVRHEGLLLIDEVQRVPELFLAIKADVDRDQAPGRYLLTGSAQVLALPRLADTLAGRMEIVELWPFSQGEILGHEERLIDELLTGGDGPATRSDLAKRDYLEFAARGGFPEAVKRVRPQARARWFDAYVDTLAQRDVAELAAIERLSDLPHLLRLVAARTAGLLNVHAVARDAGLAPTTLRRYLALLETAFVIQRVPAWTASRTKRLVHAPKLYVSDSGLAAHLLGATPTRLAEPGQDAGPVLETFVVMELRRHLSRCAERVTLYHFRTKDGAEVDAVLEAADGRVVGVEVKAGATVRSGDFRGLRQLRARTGDYFRAGVVLYAGAESLPFGDALWALPISVLWE